MSRYNELVKQVQVRHDDECWPFPSNSHGYAMLRYNGRMGKAAILAYTLRYGPVPDGLILDHICLDKGCWNPDHLEPVTNAENVRRGAIGRLDANLSKTHCPRGHPYDDDNTYWKSTVNGMSRVCRTCHRDAERERRNGNDIVNRGR